MTAVSQFFGETLAPYGLEYIQLDDGYERQPIPPNANGLIADAWLETNEQFPGGHQAIVNHIKTEGLIPGIWTNSNITNPDFAQTQPEALIKNEAGEPMLGEWIDYLLNGEPETLQKHVAPYYRGLRELGYEYFKTDAIRHSIFDGLHEAVRQGLMSNKEAAARFRAILQTAREAIGDSAYFLASWGVLSEAVGLVDACRIAMDANPTWAGVRMQLVESARWFHTQRVLFCNDPYHICARAKLEWVRSLCSLVSITGQLYMLSDPLADYDEDRLEIIRKTLPPLETVTAETGCLPLDFPAFTWTKLHGFAVPRENPVEAEDVTVQEARYIGGDYPTIDDDHPFGSLWAIHLQQAQRQWCVMSRFGIRPLPPSHIPLQNLALNPRQEYHVFDFWAQEYLGIVSGQVTCGELELGHCQILSLLPVLERPQFVATSRHLSMGAVSLRSESWGDNTLTLALAGIVGDTKSIWVSLPEGFALPHLSGENVWLHGHVDGRILKIDVSFQQNTAVLTLRFNSR